MNKPSKTIGMLFLCAALAAGSLAAFAGCGGEITDEAEREAVLSALEAAEFSAFELKSESKAEVNVKDVDYTLESTAEQTVSVLAYESDGNAYADAFANASSRSVRKPVGGEQSTSTNNTYALTFMRGENVYTTSSAWKDHEARPGNFDALLQELKEDRAVLKGESSAGESLDETGELEAFGALATEMGAKVMKDGKGYRVTFDIVEGTANIVENLVNIARWHTNSPNVTVGELLEDEYLSSILPALLATQTADSVQGWLVFAIEDGFDEWVYSYMPEVRTGESSMAYFNRCLDSAELYARLGGTGKATLRDAQASKLFGDPEDTLARLNKANRNIEAYLLGELYDYKNADGNTGSLAYTFTAKLDQDKKVKSLECELKADMKEISDDGDTTQTGKQTAKATLTVLDKAPELVSLTGLKADMGYAPTAGTYKIEPKDGHFSSTDIDGIYLYYRVEGDVNVSQTGIATVRLTMKVSLRDVDSASAKSYTETLTIDLRGLGSYGDSFTVFNRLDYLDRSGQVRSYYPNEKYKESYIDCSVYSDEYEIDYNGYYFSTGVDIPRGKVVITL